MTTIEASSQIWQYQPYESRTEFDNFAKYYLHVPPSERSYLGAYNQYRADKGQPPASILPGNWRLAAQGVDRKGRKVSIRHTWFERARVYDAYQAQAGTDALRRKILAEAQQWAQEQELALQKERDYSARLYKRADNMLSAPLYNIIKKVSPSGQLVLVIKPAGWRLVDIVPLVRLASDLNRLGLMMPKDGSQPDETWRQTLLQLGLDVDDPESWIDFLSR